MLLEEILKQEQERFIKENLLSDEMLELLKENIMPFNTLMAYYRCAIMEVETKFKVLNEEFSLQYDRNPIESIKSRIKSMDGIFKKAKKKNIPPVRNILTTKRISTCGKSFCFNLFAISFLYASNVSIVNAVLYKAL